MYGFIVLLTALGALQGCQKKEAFPEDAGIDKSKYEYVSDWQEGYLDIHQISTGRGNVAWLVLPDGTTMLVDMGDLGADIYSQEIMKPKPSSTKSPAEWVAQYIRHFSAPLDNDGKLDYVFLTHFHGDHIGAFDRLAVTDPDKNYKLQGITHLAELLEIDKLVDRAYPNYDIPSASAVSASNSGFSNYREFVRAREAAGKSNEMFSVGSNSQFVLLYKANSYPNFSIRNLAGNLNVWTGSGTSVSQYPMSTTDENEYSCAIRLSYGKFDWYTGGDVKNEGLEAKIAEAAGATDVVVCNHHAYSDAMHTLFIQKMAATAYVIPVWDYYHPQPDPLTRMLSTNLYAGDRMVFAAGLVESNRIRLGDNGAKIKPDGHIMIRVYPGGDTWQVFVLNDSDEDYEIIYKTDILNSK